MNLSDVRWRPVKDGIVHVRHENDILFCIKVLNGGSTIEVLEFHDGGGLTKVRHALPEHLRLFTTMEKNLDE